MGKIKKIIQVKDGVKYPYDGGTTDLATKETAGLVELATSEEVKTGTDDTRAITPKGLKDALTSTDTNPIPDASTTVKGISRFATSEEVEAGTLNNVGISPTEMQRWVKSNTLKVINTELIFYIKQDTGNDLTANGSIDKPFKSLNACYDYIRDNYFFGTRNAIIKFLSNYTDTTDTVIVFRNFLNSNIASIYNCLHINGEGFNVNLPPIQASGVVIRLYNLNIFNTTNSYMLQSTSPQSGIIFDKNVVININNLNSSGYILMATFNGQISLISDLTINISNTSKINGILRSDLKGYFTANLTGAPKIILNGDVTFSGACIIADNLSFIRLHGFEHNGNITGPRYYVANNSVIETNKAGSDLFAGSLEGITKTGGQYI